MGSRPGRGEQDSRFKGQVCPIQGKQLIHVLGSAVVFFLGVADQFAFPFSTMLQHSQNFNTSVVHGCRDLAVSV